MRCDNKTKRFPEFVTTTCFLSFNLIKIRTYGVGASIDLLKWLSMVLFGKNTIWRCSLRYVIDGNKFEVKLSLKISSTQQRSFLVIVWMLWVKVFHTWFQLVAYLPNLALMKTISKSLTILVDQIRLGLLQCPVSKNPHGVNCFFVFDSQNLHWHFI